MNLQSGLKEKQLTHLFIPFCIFFYAGYWAVGGAVGLGFTKIENNPHY